MFRPHVKLVLEPGAGARIVDEQTKRTLTLTPTEGRLLALIGPGATAESLAAAAKGAGIDLELKQVEALLTRLAANELIDYAPSPEARATQAALLPDDVVPAFRTDLGVAPAPKAGLMLVTDKKRDRSFTLYDFEVHIARLLDGHHTVAQVIERSAKIGMPVTPESLGKFIGQMKAYGFIQEGVLAPKASPAEASELWAARSQWSAEIRELYQSALRQFRVGRPGHALEYLDALLEIRPDTPEAIELKKRVEQSLDSGPVMELSFEDLHGVDDPMPELVAAAEPLLGGRTLENPKLSPVVATDGLPAASPLSKTVVTQRLTVPPPAAEPFKPTPLLEPEPLQIEVSAPRRSAPIFPPKASAPVPPPPRASAPFSAKPTEPAPPEAPRPRPSAPIFAKTYVPPPKVEEAPLPAPPPAAVAELDPPVPQPTAPTSPALPEVPEVPELEAPASAPPKPSPPVEAPRPRPSAPSPASSPPVLSRLEESPSSPPVLTRVDAPRPRASQPAVPKAEDPSSTVPVLTPVAPQVTDPGATVVDAPDEEEATNVEVSPLEARHTEPIRQEKTVITAMPERPAVTDPEVPAPPRRSRPSSPPPADEDDAPLPRASRPTSPPPPAEEIPLPRASRPSDGAARVRRSQPQLPKAQEPAPKRTALFAGIGAAVVLAALAFPIPAVERVDVQLVTTPKAAPKFPAGAFGELKVQSGARVEQGAVIATLDVSKQKAEKEELAKTIVRLDQAAQRALSRINPAAISKAKQGVAKAKSDLAKARAGVARAKDRAKAELDVAKKEAAVERAERLLVAADAGEKARALKLEATAARERAAKLQAQIDRAFVTAPATGVFELDAPPPAGAQFDEGTEFGRIVAPQLLVKNAPAEAKDPVLVSGDSRVALFAVDRHAEGLTVPFERGLKPGAAVLEVSKGYRPWPMVVLAR
ncbi:MAG: hypothetical protein JNK82_39010 [Myxococcaceae bacterium]|nr:hypothetical protein [Myxococcaceae bacterium]